MPNQLKKIIKFKLSNPIYLILSIIIGLMFGLYFNLYIKNIFSFLYLKPHISPITISSNILIVITAILAITIPKIFEIIENLSSKYESDYIAEIFSKEVSVKVLPKVIYVNLFIVLTFYFFDSLYVIHEEINIIFIYFVYVYFLFFFYFLIQFFITVRKYLSNSGYIIKKAFEDIKKHSIQDNNYAINENDWNLGLLTTRQESRAEAIHKNLLPVLIYETKRENNGKVVEILNDYSNLLKGFFPTKTKLNDNYLIYSLGFIQYRKKNESDAYFRLSFIPETAMGPLFDFITLFSILHKKSIEFSNTKISRESIIQLSNLLYFLLCKNNMDDVLELLFRELTKSSIYSLEKEDESFWGTFQWYNKIFSKKVFDSQTDVCYKYFPIINKYSWIILKEVIGKNRYDIFERILEHFLLNIPSSYEEIKLLKEKQNSIRVLTYKAAIYSIFFKKYDYIKLIWEAKEPSDSDATWCGEDISFCNTTEVCEFYFNKRDLLFDNEMLTGRHGIKKYLTIYFILSLGRFIPKYTQSKDDQIIPQPNISSYKTSQLSNILYQINVLKGEVEKIDKVLWGKLFPFISEEKATHTICLFFDQLGEKAEEQRNKLDINTQLSDVKIKKLLDDISNSYNHSLFSFLLKSKTIIKNYENKKEERGVFKQLYDRIALVDDSWCSFVGFGENFGRALAVDKDNLILAEIIGKSEKISRIEQIKKLIMNSAKKFILLTNEVVLYKMFSEYKMEYSRNSNGMIGNLQIDSIVIPVYFAQGFYHEQLLLLNMNKLGELFQYIPDKENEKNIFHPLNFISLTIKELKKDDELRKKIIKEKPKWLIEKGGNNLDEYLKKQIQIDVWESYEFIINENNFEGYYYGYKNEESCNI